LLIAVAVPCEKTKQLVEQVPTLASVLGSESPVNAEERIKQTQPIQVASEKKSEKPLLGDGVNLNPYVQ